MNAPFLQHNKADINQGKTRRKRRIGNLAVLPVFFNLQEKPVIIVGGTDAAAWKAELLAASGARVRVHASKLDPEFIELINANPRRYELVPQSERDADYADASLIICDAPNEMEAKRIKSIARLYGLPLNVIDKPEFCDFQFGSIVNRSPVVIGISTNGAAPIFGQAIRRRIEAILPCAIADWAQLATDVRAKATNLLRPGKERRQFWEKFVDRAFTGEPHMTSKSELFANCAEIQSEKTTGIVTTLGYCQNDSEMLTIKAMRALQAADVIIHSRSTPEAVLEYARREALRVVSEHAPELAAIEYEGQHVAILVEGNPCLFDQAEMASPKITRCEPETASI